MIDFEVAQNIDDGTIMHDLINETFGEKKTISHEWYFLSLLSKAEILKNNEIVYAFVMFVMQYYPYYKWRFFKSDDYLATALCECELNAFQFQKKYKFNLAMEEEKEDYLINSMILGDIVADFLIRYRNYSLIKCSGQHIILTAQSDCHKRFEKYLFQGYTLERRAKIEFIKKPSILNELNILSELSLNPKENKFFYKLPVLPTRDIGYPIDEIIETDNGEYKYVR